MILKFKALIVIGLVFMLNACTEKKADKEEKVQLPTMEWYKGFGTNAEEHIHEGWQTNDGGYIGIGHNWEKQGSEYTNMLVVKVDPEGNENWVTELGTENQWDVGICVHEVADGYLVGGGFYNAASGNQQRGLAKLDASGEVVWQKTYADSMAGAVRGIDITADGDIVATGYVGSANAGFIFIVEEAKGFIMKTDADGTLLWDNPLSAPQGTKVRIEKNGGLAVASTQRVFSNGKANQDVVLIRTDDEGNEIYSNHYGGENNDQCFDFDLTPDGGYILTGHTLSYGAVNWDFLLMKIDGFGNLEWVQTFGQPRGYDPAWIHDESYGVRATPDGGYIVAGGTGDEYAYSEGGHLDGPSDEWKAYLVKTDGKGNLLWEAVYPPGSVGGNNAAEFVALTNDGGYMVFTDTDTETPPEPNNFGFMKIEPDN